MINPIYVTDTYISDIDDDTWWEMLEIAEWQEKMSNLLDDFSRKHNWQWQAGINGRSGGCIGGRYVNGRFVTGSDCGGILTGCGN